MFNVIIISIYIHILNYLFIYINATEIPGELSRENMISSHGKRWPLLWLHNKSRLSQKKSIKSEMVWYFIGVYNNKQNITWPLGDTKFLFLSKKYFSTLDVKFCIPRSHVQGLSPCCIPNKVLAL